MDQRHKQGILRGALAGAVFGAFLAVTGPNFEFDLLVTYSFLGGIIGWLFAIVASWFRSSGRQRPVNKIELLEKEYGFNPFRLFSHVFNEEAARTSVMGGSSYDKSGTKKPPFMVGLAWEKYDSVVDQLLTGDKSDVEVLDELTDLMEDYYGVEYSLPRSQRGGSGARLGNEQSLRFLGVHPETKVPVILRHEGSLCSVEYRDLSDLDTVTLSVKSDKGQIGLSEAVELLDNLPSLPRELGLTEDGLPVSTSVGRFGPYIRYGDRYVSLRDQDDPYTISLERAIELIEEKKVADANRVILDFEDAGVQVLNGRYGPYITDGSKNARVPKDRDPKSLELDECKELLAAAPDRGRLKRPSIRDLSPDSEHSESQAIADRRPKFDIDKDSWSSPGNALKTLCISQSDLSIRWHMDKFYPGEKSEFSRIGSREIDGRHFDVYEAKAGTVSREYWMDCSYWYGRGVDLSPKRSLPPPGQIVTALDLFTGPSASNFPQTQEQLVASKGLLSMINVRFSMWSSDQFSHAVATPPKGVGETPTIFATAVRQYIADDLPLLHGFRFVAPFIVHQIFHALGGEMSDYHTDYRADYYRPEPGVECIDFDWLPSNSPAHDFWNYMLAGHKPGAFSEDGERSALVYSIKSIVAGEYVSDKELLTSLEAMRIAEADKDQLRVALSQYVARG